MPASSRSFSLTGKEEALVVLGCKTIRGAPSSAMERRLRCALEIHDQNPHLPVILSGGKAWDGHVECAVMALFWEASGKEAKHMHQEHESQTTRQNARYVALLCERLGYRHVVLVTCDFHMRRARRLFAEHGLFVTEAPAYARRGILTRARLAIREWGAWVLERWGS